MSNGNDGDYAVRLRGVTKSFGRTPVLRGIDLDVPTGQVLSLLGPNGSGKTTLINILATLARADAGQVHVGGMALEKNGSRIRREIGVVTHDPLLYDDLTARENLRFTCQMFGLDRIDERIERVAGLVGMTSRLDQRSGTMSHGMKKRFSIARSLLHDPSVLLMDEPDSGLDQEALALLDALITEGSNTRRTVIMATHNLDRAIALGDRVAILANGRVVYHESASDVDERSAREAYSRHTGDAR